METTLLHIDCTRSAGKVTIIDEANNRNETINQLLSAELGMRQVDVPAG